MLFASNFKLFCYICVTINSEMEAVFAAAGYSNYALVCASAKPESFANDEVANAVFYSFTSCDERHIFNIHASVISYLYFAMFCNFG